MEINYRGVEIYGQHASESSPLINRESESGEAFVSVSLQSNDDSQSEQHQPLQITKSSCIFSTGQIAKVMLFCVGLWNPRCGIRAVIPVLYALCSGVFTGYNVVNILPEIENSENHPKWELWPLFFELFLLGFSAFQMITYLVLLFSVCCQSRRPNALTLSDAFKLVSKQDWWIINFQIAVVLLLVLSFCIVGRLLPVIPWIFPFLFWLLLGHGTGCWLFAIMTTALQQKVEHCLNQIKELQRGTIDDVIDIHERLCEQVFETVAGLKIWFIIHWLSSWVLCVLTIVTVDKCWVFLRHSEADTKYLDSSPPPWQMYASWLNVVVLMWYTFIAPCVYASRLTGSCRSIIDHLNKTKRRDWNEDHPLSCRATLSHFLGYVERRKCGFKIGQLTFDSRVSWLSFFLSFCGFTVKAFA